MVLKKRLPVHKSYIGRDVIAPHLLKNTKVALSKIGTVYKLPFVPNFFKIWNSYNINSYLSILCKLPSPKLKPTPNTKSWLLDTYPFHHPTLHNYFIDFLKNSSYRLVGFPITILEPGNFRYESYNFWTENFELLTELYLKKSEWNLPKKNIKHFIRLRRVSKYKRVGFGSASLLKKKKLYYIIKSIQKFLLLKSSQVGLPTHSNVRLFSGPKKGRYKIRRQGRWGRVLFASKLSPSVNRSRAYIRKGYLLTRLLSNKLHRQLPLRQVRRTRLKRTLTNKLIRRRKSLSNKLRLVGLFKSKLLNNYSSLLARIKLKSTRYATSYAKKKRLGVNSSKLASYKKSLDQKFFKKKRLKHSSIFRYRQRLFKKVLKVKRFAGLKKLRFRLRGKRYFKIIKLPRRSRYRLHYSKLWLRINRRHYTKRSFNYFRRSYSSTNISKDSILGGLSSKYYLESNFTKDYSSVKNLYLKILFLLLKKQKKSSVVVRSAQIKGSYKSVKPYLFLNKVLDNSTVPQRPIKSLKLRLRDLGNVTAAKVSSYTRLPKPRRFLTKSLDKNYLKVLKKSKYVLHHSYKNPYSAYTVRGSYTGVGDLCTSLLNTQSNFYYPKLKLGGYYPLLNYSSYFLSKNKYKTNKRSRIPVPQRKLTYRPLILSGDRLRLYPKTLSQLPTINLHLLKKSLVSPVKLASANLYARLSKRLHLQATNYKSFVFGNIGMFLVYQSNILKHNPLALKLLITKVQKRQYSFWFKSDDKRRIMNQRKKQVLARIIFRSKQIQPSGPWLSYTSAATNLVRKTMLTATTRVAQNSTIRNLVLRQPNKTRQIWSLTTGAESLPTILNSDLHRSGGYGNSHTYVNRDPQITRIRFKPGYQRIWREARSALLEIFSLKYQYQKRITKFVIGYAGYSAPYQLNSASATLAKTLIFSRLVHNLPTGELLITQSLVFLNLRIATDARLLVSPNDFIQILISLRYYLTFRWFSNWAILRLRRIRRLVFRKNKPKSYKASNLRKHISRYTPNWVYDMRYDDFDVKPYLEVDYLTLSVFVLTEPNLMLYYRSYDSPDLPIHHSIYRMYNWKYIN